MMMSALRVIALCACMCFTLGVVLEGNGYHIKVAINKQVPEDPQIISQLKDALVSASNYLYRSTRNHFYIKNVTILVPETWESKPEWKPSSLIFREADIRVDSPHPSMGSNPYTFQPGLCGDEGRYIHLTPDFVLDDRGNRKFYYGDFGRLLVHEFAHLRYGVFDEYGDKDSHQHPVGYVNNNKLEPTACSKDIKGTFLNMKTEEACILSDENRLSDDCAFIVNSFESNATSSVMFAQYLDEVVDFCETNTIDPKLKHNADAPNKQNKMCNATGTWDIIKEHPDFLHSSANNVADTTPKFEVVQHQMKVVNGTGVCGRRFVFVLDISGSMSGPRIFKQRQTADNIIRDILPLGTEVGIVTFSSSARVLADMRYLTSEADRQTLAVILPTSVGGGTAIGRGLLEGIDLLEENNKSAADGRIFLITDGGENRAPNVSSILSEIVSKKVVVHTLAYSRAAAVVLRELSDRTAGFYSFFDESDASTDLESAALRFLKDITICESGEESIEILRQAIVMNTSTNSYKQNIDIDSTIGNNTLFVFTLSSGATTKIQVTDPNGNVYDDKTPNYSKDETLNIIRFHFPDAQQGLWKYALERGTSSTESVVAVVKSNQRSPGTLPIQVESWVRNTTVDLGTGQGLVVYSYVHQGYAPIIKAEVKAVVSGMDVKKEITFWDNGTFPDNAANDGVYTRFVVGFSANERHSLDISVKSVDGQTAVIRERPLSSSRAPVIYPNNTVPVVLEPVDPFTRTSSAGAVDVEGFVPNVDQIDPGRVTDLEVIISDRDNRHVTLTWTAPGDDLNEGTVDRYDIRIAESFEHLRQNFSVSYKILESDIKKGDDSPVPAGSQQSMTVSLSGHLDGDSYVFGLKAFDESNGSSDLSNLKAVTFAKIVIPGPSPDEGPDEGPDNGPDNGPDKGPDDPPNQPMLLIIIVASICFVVLVLVAVVVSCLICKLCRKKPKSDTNRI